LLNHLVSSSIQVFLNGEPIITSQRTFKSTPLKSGTVTGLTGSEVCSLPAGGARIAVALSEIEPSEKIEVFLQLQKL
jgi:hypothetical protein